MVARKVWGDFVITNRTRLFDNNRFPTTTFGNDDKKKSKSKNQCHPRGFLSGICRSVREQQRRTTDPGLQHSRMTATTNNRFPTTTFGNDGYFALVVIPECFGGPQGSGICCLLLLFIDWLLTGLKDPYKRVFPSRSKKGLTRFFFLIHYHYGPGRVI